MRSRAWEDPRWAALLLLGTAALAAVDLATGNSFVLSGLYVVAPAVAGSVLGPRMVVTTTAWAALLALLVALVESTGAVRDRISVAAGVVVVGVLAAAAAGQRVRRERAYVQLSLVAEVAQATIIRPIPPRLGGLEIATVYRSAAEEAQVGGDAYAALLTPQGVRAVVADVRGKGLGAVAVAADLLASFRETAATEISLSDLARHLEASLRPRMGPEDFVTALLLQFRDGELTLVSCGHPWPLLLRAGAAGEVSIPRPGVPLGLGVRPHEHRMPFLAGDQLLVFTDGLIEARDPAGDFFDPLPVLATAPAGDSPQRLLQRVIDGLDAHVAGRLSDDLAALLIKRTGPAAPAPSG